MHTRTLFTLLSAAALAMAALYAPQPILPKIALHYGVSVTEAASLITWSLLPVGLAPLVAGLILQRVAPSRLAAACLLVLGLAEAACVFAPPFDVLVTLRLVQGGCIALLLPSVMTYIALAAEDTHALRRCMGFYVGAAVLGGLVGRLLAGYLSEAAPWPSSFAVLAALILVVAALAARLPRASAQSEKRPVELAALAQVFRHADYVLLFVLVFAAFFAFTGLLNFVPFRLDQIATGEGGGDSGRIALSYIGFLCGLATSVFSAAISKKVGGPLRAVALGTGVLTLAVVMLTARSEAMVFLAIAASAGGFFLIHAVLSSHINTLGHAKPEAVNSAYVSLYYLGGAVGSLVPGFFYEFAGWSAVVYVLLATMAISLASLGFIWRRKPVVVAAGE